MFPETPDGYVNKKGSTAMSDNENTSTENTDTLTPEREIVPGTWQDVLTKSATLFDRSNKGRTKASELLWMGAQTAIEEWLPEADTDVSAENMYGEVLDILGKPRKGDASKIKAVALAVKNNGLVLTLYPNLSKAYAEAMRLTKTVKVHAEEDEAAESATAVLASTAPKSSSTPEGAAMIVLAQGVDEAARLLLDALGQTNTAAHRALARALSQEIAGRIAPPVKVVKAGAKAGAQQAGASGASPKAAVKTAGTKAKPVKKAAAGSKAKPVAKAGSKAQPVQAADEAAPEVEDMFDQIEDDAAFETGVEAPRQTAKTKAAPVRRGPVRRAS